MSELNDDKKYPAEHYRVPSVGSFVYLMSGLNVFVHFAIFYILNNYDDSLLTIVGFSVILWFFNIFLYVVYGWYSTYHSRIIEFYMQLTRYFEILYGMYNSYYDCYIDDPTHELKELDKTEPSKTFHKMLVHNANIERSKYIEMLRENGYDLDINQGFRFKSKDDKNDGNNK